MNRVEPWVSPLDRTPLREIDGQLQDATGNRFPRVGDVWDLVVPTRRPQVDRWAAAYSTVRAAEGRGAPDEGFYRRLPDVAPDTPLADHWAVRARGFAAVGEHLASIGAELDVLDLGCGNGWAGARLVEQGHRACLIDVVTDDLDGLGARHHHGVELPAVRAEFDRLPLGDASVDVVLSLASLHYAPDQTAAVAEAARVLRPGGAVFVVDSPVFRHRPSGASMVREQEARLTASLDVEVPPTPGRGFVWRRAPEREWSGLGLSWRVEPLDRGLRPNIGRLVSTIRVRREPASFMMMIGTKP